MTRTELDIDPAILSKLVERQRREGKSLGRLVSELLSSALAAREGEAQFAPLAWSSRPMQALIDLDDAEAVRRGVDES